VRRTQSTTISFALPQRSLVDLSIYDIRGRLVRRLAHDVMVRGRSEIVWDGTDARGRRVVTGVCFYRLQARGQQITRRMALIRWRLQALGAVSPEYSKSAVGTVAAVVPFLLAVASQDAAESAEVTSSSPDPLSVGRGQDECLFCSFWAFVQAAGLAIGPCPSSPGRAIAALRHAGDPVTTLLRHRDETLAKARWMASTTSTSTTSTLPT
jgi:hypothetical protein